MRVFEILILTFAALGLLPFFFPGRPGLRRLRWFSISAVAVLVLHLWLEGARWQMWPTYALLALALLLLANSLLRKQWPALGRTVRTVAGALLILWLAVAIALPTTFPVPHPLPPTGPYGVGTRVYYLIDDSRPEIYSDDVEHRELMLQVWYPAEVAEGSEPASFIEGVDVAGPAIARRLGLPPLITGHLNLAHTSSYRDAPAVDGPWPLLIFSHGLTGVRVQNTSMVQELASHGYVVAAIDHPYANAVTIFPDGRVTFYNASAVMPSGVPREQSGARLVGVWVEDIAFVLRQLEAWSQTPGHALYERIDAQRLGLFGHSTGGGAAIQGCATIDACEAALALDGWIQPVSSGVRQAPYEPALMMISAPDWLGPANRALGEQLYAQRQGPGYLLTVEGTVHFDYTDIPLMSPVTPLLGLSGDVDGPRMVRVLNRYAVAFFDQILKDQPSTLLEGPSDDFPEIRFGE